jgi:hypothetical protein
MAVIDLSIVVVTWSSRVRERRDPALTRIEYHRSPYRFLRKYRERSRMAVVLIRRIATSLFSVMSQPPPALLGGRQGVHRDVQAEAPR